MTALLTIFVWVSADQLVRETAELPVSISIKSEPNSRMVISLGEGAPESFTVSVSGRQADVTALREAGTIPVILTLRDEAIQTRGLGLLNIPLRDALRHMTSAFGSCVIHAVTPPTLSAIIDRRVDVSLPIRVRPGSVEYAVEPRVDLDTVTVTILQSTYDGIQESNPRITLDVESYFKNQPEDVPVKLSARIEPVVETEQGSYAAFAVTPETVTVRATLRRRLKEGTIQAVPIKFRLSPNVHHRYDIEFRKENPDETLRINVIGIPEEVDRLVSGERKTFAVIALSNPGPLAGGVFGFYEPEFNLPPGVKLVEDQTVPSFELRLVPRKTPSAADGP